MSQERITFAQKKLLVLSDDRALSKWSEDNNLDRTLMQKISKGKRIPTYKLMCQTCDIISPAEWVYFTDEKVPYQFQTVPKWNVEEPSYFILKHREDWSEIGAKYGFDRIDAYNLFCTLRLRPSFVIIRQFLNDVNPIEFFCNQEYLSTKLQYPDTGDIILHKKEEYFVISSSEQNKLKNAATICKIDNGTVSDIKTISLSIFPDILRKLPSKETQKIIREIKNFLF